MPTEAELQAKIEALEAKLRTATDQADDDDPGVGKPIPYSRWTQHRQQLRGLSEDLAAVKVQLGKTVTDIAKAKDDAIKETEKAHKSALEAARAEAAVDLSLSDLGVKSPAIRKLLREHHAMLSEDAKKTHTDPAAWLKARRAETEAAKGDKGKKAPPPIDWLDPYEAAIQGQGQETQRRGPPPKVNEGAGPKGDGTLGASDIEAMDLGSLASMAGWGKKEA